MGQTLSEPVTAKETSSCSNELLKVGASCMQGWRINMEDAHTHLLSLPEDHGASFFAVYDGHGGAKVAQYAGSHLHKKIVGHPLYKKGNIEEAIRQGFLAVDTDMLEDESMKDELAGTTAVVVLLKGNKIYCGNVGDSRAVASIGGQVQQLSYDHKPGNEAETKRIIAAGGWVEFNRVNGNLALSRALGDFVFKKNDKKAPEEQIVTAYPDVVVKEITPDHEFIILACDGIWDVMSNEEVVAFVRARIAKKMEPEHICEELMTRCLAPDCQMGGLGCDNMTVVLISFLQFNSYEKLALKCQRQIPMSNLMDKESGCARSESSTLVVNDDEDVSEDEQQPNENFVDASDVESVINKEPNITSNEPVSSATREARIPDMEVHESGRMAVV
ncbi:probable protein phosphatase 2C T23F11.1 isoform X2 [Limulus polyphemus]|uniref:protein-serine/threonine phosphatase n=1 Tax=Limulus polyphemus TaxID=6850 RepID=A0ABM1BWE7_LIMPO|nr:probable protein phosphatase 2C T23F11.1 isoform X2 [Limulus polyphemus]XP_013789963.1 probable protein phosphatase 2C T23F11.1 isoform X2 [Limulus polyphemus]